MSIKLNIGGGKQKAKGWTIINKKAVGKCLQLDLNKIDKLPFEDNSVDVVFMGNIVEHLTDETNLKTFKEIYRILKPKGLLRITTPDFDIFYDIFIKNDIDKFKSFTGIRTKATNTAEVLLNNFISWNTQKNKKWVKSHIFFDRERFKEILSINFNNLKDDPNSLVNTNLEMYISWTKTFLPKSQSDLMLLHINTFNYKRLKYFLLQAGFNLNNIFNSSYLESKYDELNKLGWDKFKERSLYVEGIK